jgi:hypothetical protein
MERGNVTIIHDLIVAFAGDYVADAAFWTWHISIVPGYNMDVGMKYGLPRCFAAVNANIEPLGFENLLQYILDLSHKVEGVRVFIFSHLPDRYSVSLWNNEGMALGNRKAVKKRKRQVTLGQ